jgi:hypothetical protein
MAEQHAQRPRTASRRAPARSAQVSGAAEAARVAADSLAELIDHPVEGSSEVSRSDNHGWLVGVDVVEVLRIPDTTSLMATYEVELGDDGGLRGYRRVRRYRRGDADE